MWFTDFDINMIGRITTSGQVSTYSAPGIISPAVITPGPDGTLWFTNSSGTSVGEITFSS